MASELLHGVRGTEPHRDAPRQQEPTADAQEEAPATAQARADGGCPRGGTGDGSSTKERAGGLLDQEPWKQKG